MEVTSRQLGSQDQGAGEQSRVETQTGQLSVWRGVIALGQDEVEIQPDRNLGPYECCHIPLLGPPPCGWTRCVRKKEGEQKRKDSLEGN